MIAGAEVVDDEQITLPPETYAVSFSLQVMNQRKQSQFRTRVNYFLAVAACELGGINRSFPAV